MNGLPCPQFADCWNSPEHRSDSAAMCLRCRWSDDADPGVENLWRPKILGTKHPKVAELKKAQKQAKVEEKRKSRRTRDRVRQYYSKVAASAEQRTNRNLPVKATRNSGRSNRDADHVLPFSGTAPLSKITLDTKNQSAREHPVVNLAELDKVRQDARNAGSLAGGLVIRNRFGRAVVVFAEEDVAKLFL